MKTAAVISYSSYQKHFIKHLIREARKFVTGEIVVVSFDRMFNGEPEEPFKSYGDIDLRLKFIPGHESRYYHNLQRKAGYDVLQGEYDAVFFFDADEVPIGDKMALWLLNKADPGDYRFASYWYYRDTCYQAELPVDSLALVSTESLKTANWFGPNEREGFSEHHLWHRLTTYQDKPLVHHYSWAGTKEMLLKKVTSWGHNEDRDWVSMVEDEYSHAFTGRCPFKEEDKYKTIKPAIGFTFNKEVEDLNYHGEEL